MGIFSVLNRRNIRVRIAGIAAAAMAFSTVAYLPANGTLSAFAEKNVQTEETITLSDLGVDADDYYTSDELYEGYITRLFYPDYVSIPQKYSRDYARSELSAKEKMIYDALKPEIEKVAAGTRASTAFSVRVTWTFSELGVTSSSSEVAISNAVVDKVRDINFRKLLNAVVEDFPYELYWFDYTLGWSANPGSLGSYASGGYIDYTISLAACKNYRGAGLNTVNTTKTGAASKAVAKADAIAAANKGLAYDVQIKNFCKEICDLVTYNTAAVGNSATTGIDPWQLIYVFDGNPSTNVVCEGYSKAFKYLCDKNGIECYTVGGNCGGDHMWNIVVLDGKSYLVDVTNCDSDTIGYPDKLCLKGATKSSASGCRFSSLGMTYTYDSDTTSVFGGKSFLVVSTSDYTAGAHTHSGTKVAAKDATCTKEGNKEYWSCSCGKLFSDSACTTEITADSVKIEALGHLEDTSAWSKNKNYHWHVCSRAGCKETFSKAKHTSDTGTVVTAPTATTDGVKEYACTVCGYVIKTEKIPATGDSHTHSYTISGHDSTNHWNECECGEKDPDSVAAHTIKTKKENVVLSTCGEKGSHDVVRYCKVCNAEISRETVEDPLKSKHTWDSGVVTTSPTETTPGEKTYTCSVCGTTKTEEIPALGGEHTHSYTTVGHDETSHWNECSCGEKDPDSIAAHTWDGGVETTAPTETTPGVKTYTCTGCPETKTEEIPATGSEHTHSYTIVKYDSTSHWNECSCGAKDISSVAAHTWDAGVETTAPTETTPGVKTYTCNACPATKTETIPATGEVSHNHTFSSAWSADDIYHWHDATCGHSVVSDRAQHSWDNGVIVREPTIIAEGLKLYTCTICGKERKVSVPASGGSGGNTGGGTGSNDPAAPSRPNNMYPSYITVMPSNVPAAAPVVTVNPSAVSTQVIATTPDDVKSIKKSVITFDAAADKELSAEVLSAFFKNKSAKTLTVKAGGFKLKIEKKNISDSKAFGTADLSLNGKILTEKQIRSLNAFRGSKNIVQLNLADNDFDGINKITVQVYVGKSYAGRKAEVFEVTGKNVKKIASSKVDSKGYVSFDVNHLGKFIVSVK